MCRHSVWLNYPRCIHSKFSNSQHEQDKICSLALHIVHCYVDGNVVRLVTQALRISCSLRARTTFQNNGSSPQICHTQLTVTANISLILRYSSAISSRQNSTEWAKISPWNRRTWRRRSNSQSDTQITTTKKDEAQRIKSEIELEHVSIKGDQIKTQQELDKVTPAIKEAKHSVSNISKSKLYEIRRLSSPPEVIIATLTSVLMLLGLSASNWTAIKKTISGDGFIKTVLEFNIDNVTPQQEKSVSNYLVSDKFSLNTVALKLISRSTIMH